ncbi:MAG TPA: hypothetical protein VMS17_05625 [Gemmataceae bacterium]|nr:hypothetical protein [Gemmataceae bacterium]
MADTSLITGVLLIILGLSTFFSTGLIHYTALIPAGFGLVLGVLGAVGRKENMRKHAMHAAAAVALIGCLLALGRLVYKLFTDGITDWAAGMSLIAMAALCGGFTALCVKSFIDARRRRKADAAPPP